MQFWRLDAPADDDYRAVFVNGEARCEHELPAVGCRTCGRLRCSGRVLPVDCPPAWESRPAFSPPPRRAHRVADAEFAQIRAELEPAIGPFPAALGGLEPGDRFQPVLLRVPSRPTADLLWPGVGDLLASERVRALWEREGFTGIVFSRAEFERVGRRPATATLRTRGGEPEDVLRRIPAAVHPGGLPRYWYATVAGTSELPPGVDATSVCAECGRAVVPALGSSRRILFESRMWRGEDATLLATTRYVIVTDRVRLALEQLGATNVRFLPAEEEIRT
jgi:hypothetical protein